MAASRPSLASSPSIGFLVPTAVSVPSLNASAVAASILAVLLIGVARAVLTTTDPLWWQLHFSRLGEFRDSSGFFFNGTLITAGALIVVFAWFVHADVRRLGAHRARRGAALVNATLIACVGISLGCVGMVPLNVNQFFHDQAASGIVLSFAALLISSTVLLARSIKRLALANATAFVLIVIAATLFVSGTINLALFEAVGFSTIFGWVGVFTRCLSASVRIAQSERRAVTIESATHTVSGRPLRALSLGHRIPLRRATLRRVPARRSRALRARRIALRAAARRPTRPLNRPE